MTKLANAKLTAAARELREKADQAAAAAKVLREAGHEDAAEFQSGIHAGLLTALNVVLGHRDADRLAA